MLSALVKGLLCLECGAASLVIRVVDHRLGLVAAMETCCTECGAVLNSTLTSDRIDKSTAGNAPFIVLRQAVAASMDMGVCHAGLVKLCRFLDMKPMTHTSFTKHAHVVCHANMVVVTRMFDNAADVVRRVYRDTDPSIGEDDTIDLIVSFDGSWMTRGHNSQYGVGCVVEVLTGLVIDLQVMSLYCQRCAYASTRHGGMDTMEFKHWFRAHEPECNRNYKGASFNSLTNLRVYGDVELKKAECINHVAKRLGTALRKLAASGKKAGITLGGRGFGKLTQATINKLTAYYGKAVRAHPKDVCGMPYWQRSTMQSPLMRSLNTTAARWELTAGASTRRRSPPDRSQDHIGRMWAHHSHPTSQNMSRACTPDWHTLTCWNAASSGKRRTPMKACTRSFGTSAPRRALSAWSVLSLQRAAQCQNLTLASK